MSGEIMKIMWDNLDLLWWTFRREYGWVSYAYTGNENTRYDDDDDDDSNVNDDDRGGGRGGGG